MRIHFGLQLDDSVYHHSTYTSETGTHFLGPKGLLSLLEQQLGLAGWPEGEDFLRVEQYRQVLLKYIAQHPDAFFTASLHSDQFATAEDMLERRDELLLAGWDFSPKSVTSHPRLKTIAELEQLLITDPKLQLSVGNAERILAVILALSSRTLSIATIVHQEPFDLLPVHWQRLLTRLLENGISVTAASPSIKKQADTDLGHFQRRVLQNDTPTKAKWANDGSLLVLRAPLETDLAAVIAQWVRREEDFRPLCLIQDQDRSLDRAIVQEDQPALGILSQSAVRPSLQVLKLITAFLWQPLDPKQIMEFLSLQVKPMEDGLAEVIATVMAEQPGIGSDLWWARINEYYGKHPEQEAELRQEYRFWFERTRYDRQEGLPKTDAIDIYRRLWFWAQAAYADSGGNSSSLRVLAEQAKRIGQLLELLPEDRLRPLDLERVVRTIYEPPPLEMQAQELGSLPYVYQAANIFDAVPTLLWWNFTQADPDYFFSRWYPEERTFLAEQGVTLRSPKADNELLLWRRRHALRMVTDRLILVIPELVGGEARHPHPLLDDLQAAVKDTSAIIYDLRKFEDWGTHFPWLLRSSISQKQLGQPTPFIRISPEKWREKEYETPSSLEDLLYYPHKWVFRHQARLRRSAILSIVPEVTLLGNLAHRFFEHLLAEKDVLEWPKDQVYQWVMEFSRTLLAREGAPLLLYGKEPERIDFLQRIQYAAWNLLQIISKSGWSIQKTELALEGVGGGVTLKGRSDLVLARGDERVIVDLKWRGKTRRKLMIQSQEDIQLMLYASLLETPAPWPHTAYYIINTADMLSRSAPFTGVRPLAPDMDYHAIAEDILQQVERTHTWRRRQLDKGQIEIRCAATHELLEAHYGAALLDVLEMKREDAPFDEYRVLIGLGD